LLIGTTTRSSRASRGNPCLICAFSTARVCRVSTQITGKPASARALNSHCSGPHFTISLKRTPQTFSYPQERQPITPSFGGKADMARAM